MKLYELIVLLLFSSNCSFGYDVQDKIIFPVFHKDLNGQISIEFASDDTHTKLVLEFLQVQKELSVAIQDDDKFNSLLHNVTQCHYKAKLEGKLLSRGIVSLCKGELINDGSVLFDGIIEDDGEFLLFNAFNGTQIVQNTFKLENDTSDMNANESNLPAVTIKEVKVIDNITFFQGFDSNIEDTVNYAISSTLTQNFRLESLGFQKLLVELEILKSHYSNSYINETLLEFKDHVRDVTKKRTPHDATYLWSGQDFLDKAGATFRESLLFSSISVAVISLDANDALQGASIELHELLHMVGVGHDNSSGFVMSMDADNGTSFLLSSDCKNKVKSKRPYLAKHLQKNHGKTSDERTVCDDEGHCVCREWFYFGQQCEFSLLMMGLIGIGIVSIVLLFAFGYCWLRKRRRSSSYRESDFNIEIMDQGKYKIRELT